MEGALLATGALGGAPWYRCCCCGCGCRCGCGCAACRGGGGGTAPFVRGGAMSCCDGCRMPKTSSNLSRYLCVNCSPPARYFAVSCLRFASIALVWSLT